MTALPSTDKQPINMEKASLKLKYRALKTRGDDKFEAWIMAVEERWLEEIAACIQGQFPDWQE
ncbi:MAG: hypothetical protein LDL41_08140 [Coleofasciculus sp. S288]|nr:hypothetical protein [Coleofasciculus sp. S288]